MLRFASRAPPWRRLSAITWQSFGRRGAAVRPPQVTPTPGSRSPSGLRRTLGVSGSRIMSLLRSHT
eukprot:14469905-Alexandrium_andersonii.AAC.1